MFCYAVLSVFCSFTVILLMKREKEGDRCFSLIVFLLVCVCYSSKPLSYGAVGWSAVCDCGISWSYSLLFWSFHVYYNQNRSALLCKLVSDNSLFASAQIILEMM